MVDPARATLKGQLGELLLRLQAPLPADVHQTLWVEFEFSLRAYVSKITTEQDKN